jgi:hypothetical protein
MSSPSTDNNTCKVKANVTNTSAKQSHSNLRPPRRLCVVLYAHVNGRDSEQLRSLAIQLEILRRHSCREGWTIVGEFADAEAGDSFARPGLRRALSDAQDGQYDILLVYGSRSSGALGSRRGIRVRRAGPSWRARPVSHRYHGHHEP